MILYNIKTFIKRYVFYKDDFKEKFETLKEVCQFLHKHDIGAYVCGGFAIFLLENRCYRRSKDIDLYVEQGEIARLLDILYANNINILKKHKTDEFFFFWKNVMHNVYPFKKSGGLIHIKDTLQGIPLKIPADEIIDKRYGDALFDTHNIRIADFASSLILRGLLKDSMVKKLDFYFLKKYVSRDSVQKLLEYNPEHKDTFDMSLLEYSIFRWLKDEFYCVINNYRKETEKDYV